MNKTIIPVLALVLVIAYSQSPCFGEECTYDARGDPLSRADIQTAVSTVDKELKRIYWYYLRGSRRLYQANIDTAERFIHFFIYRNIVGTFLAIGSWNHETQISEVNTFVRLGNGFSEATRDIYEPVNIQPFVISLQIKHGQTLIQIDQNGDIICRNPEQCENIELLIPFELTEEKVRKCDQYLRDNYWHYLQKAVIVHQEYIRTQSRVYSVFTYVNIVGTFLVISSCDADDNIQVNTFVRLGAGSANVQDIQPAVTINAEDTQIVSAA